MVGSHPRNPLHPAYNTLFGIYICIKDIYPQNKIYRNIVNKVTGTIGHFNGVIVRVFEQASHLLVLEEISLLNVVGTRQK